MILISPHRALKNAQAKLKQQQQAPTNPVEVSATDNEACD